MPSDRVQHQGIAAPDALPEPRRIEPADLVHALWRGWQDFRRAPAFGLLFSAFYVAGGLVLAAVALAVGRDWWLVPFVLGFPLIAPFAAVGLYEVSRRIETGRPLDWPAVIRVVFAQRDRQIPSMAVVILLMFMFWVFVAHTIFALFLGTSPMVNVTSSAEILATPRGIGMLLLGGAIGLGFAAALFTFSVFGLPLLLERETDLISAIIASTEAVRLNLPVMAAWAAFIAVTLLVAMLPLFLGLFVALPVLGHATWHLYRCAMVDEAG